MNYTYAPTLQMISDLLKLIQNILKLIILVENFLLGFEIFEFMLLR